MSGDGSSYSSRLSDGYISNVRACEKTWEGEKRKEKHKEEGNGRKKSENGVSSGGKVDAVSVPSDKTGDR